MGLVVPSIAQSGVPFAIMQPPFAEFDPILNSADPAIHLTVNGEEILSKGLCVVKSPEEVQKLLSGEKGPSIGSLVLTDPDKEEGGWADLVRKATSFTCSVGPSLPKILGPLLVDNLPKRPENEQPVLYACENDHEAVEKLKKITEGRVKVVACMVDRICSSREVLSSGTGISVTTEPFVGSIMVLTPTAELFDPEAEHKHAPIPIAGEPVFIPRTKEIANYRYQRKIFFVNHMHTTLALMTLARYRQKHHLPVNQLLVCEDEEVDVEGKVIGEIKRACMPLTLCSPANVTEVQKIELKSWMVAQILMLVQQFPLDVMLEGEHRQPDEAGLYKSLVEVATQRMMRFASVVDTCDRVLGAGVARRFEGRLLPAYEEVVRMMEESEGWEEDCPEKQILDFAGLTIQDVYWSLNRMVSEGREIAEADLVRRLGSSEDARADARLGWIVSGMHRLNLDWLCCAMGLTTEEELRTYDLNTNDEGSKEEELKENHVDEAEDKKTGFI